MSTTKPRGTAQLVLHPHSGRSGRSSAAKWSEKHLRKSQKTQQTIRPGPNGSGLISPAKPSVNPSGHHTTHPANPRIFHHQIAEMYDEK